MTEWHQGLVRALEPDIPILNAVVADVRARAARPASDGDFGKLVRRLAAVDEFKLEYVHQLLDIRDRAAADASDDWARDHAARANNLINEVTVLSQEELDSVGE